MRYARLVLVVALLIGATCYTWADFLSLPANAAIQMKFQNWDEGQQYFTGVTGDVYEGAALAALADPALPAKNANPGENSWGIVNLTNIMDISGFPTYWAGTAAGGTGGQISGIIWNETDTKLFQANPLTQKIYGTGLKFAFWYSATTDPFDPTPGPSSRLTSGGVYIPSYPTATDLGTLIWTGVAVPGFVTDPITGLIDPVNTFETDFTQSVPTSKGGFFANFEPVTYVDGFSVTHTLTGTQNDMFTPTEFSSGFFADMELQFNADSKGAGKWLLHSNDPGDAQLAQATPECSSILLLLSALGPIGLGRLRRRKRA